MNRTQLAQFRQILTVADAYLTVTEGSIAEDEPETKYPNFNVPAEELRKLLPEPVRQYVTDGLYALSLCELLELGRRIEFAQVCRAPDAPKPS